MSIWLFSGINGSGKTLNAIRVVLTDPKFAIFDDNGREVAKRPVYYFGINECTLPWTELDESSVRDWRSLPAGSVIVIDECWRVFPSRSGSKDPPVFISELAEHRRLGLDFVLISQRGMGQVDAFVRGLIERHFHLERLYGSNSVRALSWEKCADNVNDYHQRKEARHETWRLDKKYFGAYKSAELHTIRQRLPWGKLALICALPVALGFLIWFAWSTIRGFAPGPDGGVVSAAVAQVGDFVSAPVGGAGGVDDWQFRQVPRVANMPWTAPQYDALMAPKSAPLPVGCIIAVQSGRCACGTWQGTPVDVGPVLCRQIAEHGFFDNTRERPELMESRFSDRLDRSTSLAAADSPARGVARFIPSGSSAGGSRVDDSYPVSHSGGSVFVGGVGGVGGGAGGGVGGGSGGGAGGAGGGGGDSGASRLTRPRL